jgi:hypothetical protein
MFGSNAGLSSFFLRKMHIVNKMLDLFEKSIVTGLTQRTQPVSAFHIKPEKKLNVILEQHLNFLLFLKLFLKFANL